MSSSQRRRKSNIVKSGGATVVFRLYEAFVNVAVSFCLWRELATLGFGWILGLLGGCFSRAESESDTCGRLRDFVSSIGVASESAVGGGRGSALGTLSKGAVEALAGAFALGSGVRRLSEAGSTESVGVSSSITEVELSRGAAVSGRGGEGEARRAIL